MAFSSLAIPRTILCHASPRLLLCGNKVRSFAFSSTSALGNSSAVDRHATVSAVQRDVVNFGATQKFAKFPRPETIVWQKELANKVHLIGNIGKPVESKQTSTGKAFAWTTLAVRLGSKTAETTWFDLKFYGQMAEVVAEHVKTGDNVYVSGFMSHDATEGDKNLQTSMKIVVSLLNFVERDSPILPHRDANMNNSISSLPQESTNMKHAIPYTRQDTNMKHAIPYTRQDTNMKQATSGSKVTETEELWQAFFLNPTEWWDNRKDKRNPKSPDFKHKTTGDGLWVESFRNPPWVQSQLDKLNENMSFSHQQINPKKSLSSFGDSDFNLF